jgi:GDP-4-dehydro-6-deoxy-D-mannose reductase
VSNTRSKTCLLFGSTGFIGRHLMAARPLFADALGVDTLIGVSDDVDIRKPAEVRELVEANRPDFVMHLAAVSFVPDSLSDPASTYQINFVGTVNLLAALRQTGFSGRMLFVSSSEVYGAVPEASLPLREEQPFAPRNPYAVSKAAAELACLQESLTGGLDVRVVRPFNIIGPGQSPRFAVSSFARQIAALERSGGGSIAVGNLNVTRDFVDVRDAIAAFVLALRDGHRGESYNVCSGRETLLSDLLGALTRMALAPVQVVIDPARVRPAEQQRMRGSFEKLRRAAGWEPIRTIDQSLAAILDASRTALQEEATDSKR